MYKIVVSNQCECFKKSNLENNLTFESKDEALSKAIEMKNIMNSDFCKKHKFELQEMFNNFVISFYKEDLKPDCCGNGCCM
jgi:methyltransferase-like protein